MSTYKIKIVQINIYKGRYLDTLVDFLKKEDPDFVTMQEVTTSGFSLYEGDNKDIFAVLGSKLGVGGVYNGDLKLIGDEKARFGNAVFSKHKMVGKNSLVLKSFRAVTNEELDGESGEIREQIGRSLLDAVVNFHGSDFHIMSWHGAWTAPPQDTAETMRQANMVYDYLKKLNDPFILGGDLNAVMTSKTVELIGKVANNLMIQADAKVTTNLKVHKIAPLGFLIDYIFASAEFKLNSITVPEITVSDHLPVIAELEIDL